MRCVSAASPASVVQQPAMRMGWSNAKNASKPSASARWTKLTSRGQLPGGPPATLKRTPSAAAETQGCVCQLESGTTFADDATRPMWHAERVSFEPETLALWNDSAEIQIETSRGAETRVTRR